MECKERVAIVTGAAGDGIGRSTALTLARESASVVVNYLRSEESAHKIAEYIEAAGGEAIACRADVYDEEGCERLVEEAIRAFGKVDICVFNPGGKWQPGTSLENIDPNLALENVRRELAPVYFLAPRVLPGMRERGFGRLIGIGLNAPLMGAGDYSLAVAKAARMSALRLPVEREWKHGVTLNVIAPGGLLNFRSFDEAIDHCQRRTSWLSRERASPQDVAEAVAFLCSEAGRFISGCTIPVQLHI